MGIAERKEREKEIRRNMIIDAAERVIFANRIDTSTMDQIAEEAELSKGTLYLYFKSKTDLYLAIQDRGMSILSDKLARVLGEKRKGIDLLKRFGEVYFDYANQYPNYFNAEMFCRSHEFIEEITASELFQCTREKRIEIVNFLIRGIQIGVQDGSIRRDVKVFGVKKIICFINRNSVIFTRLQRDKVGSGCTVGFKAGHQFIFGIVHNFDGCLQRHLCCGIQNGS